MDNYKAYSLQEVETWLRESLEADCTPQEIHDSIVNTVKNNMKYHRACYRDSVRLLSLLRGNKNQLDVHETLDETVTIEKDYWEGKLQGEEFNEALNRYGYEYTPIPVRTDESIIEDITIKTDK